MAASNTVIVLAPNGRRQRVKVTLNTTMLQILEEVCRKQGYNVDDYDIKHIHRILSPNTIFRFAGLPNNAQLEMVACTKAHSTSNITIAIKPHGGEKIYREFPSDTTLAQALTDVYPDSDLERAVLIFMHHKIYGRETLEKTTLASIGLNSGGALFHLVYCKHEQLKTQAHVSTPLLPKPALAAVDNSPSDKNDQKVPLSTPHCSKTIDDATLPTSSIPSTETREKSGDETRMDVEEDEVKMNIESKAKMDVDEKVDTRSKCEESKSESYRKTDTFMIEESHSVASGQKDHDTERDHSITEACKTVQEDTYKIEFLGERNALVFNQAEIQALPKDELPDSFFDLYLHDARTLLRDAKRRREQLEDAPFLTEAQRQLDRDKRILDQLNRYRHTVIRVQFPDQFVLQALFKPLENVQTVKDFIKNYLDEPDCEFTIYTAPPKHVLNPKARLIDENLIPSAIVYYSGQSSLKPSVKAKLTDPRAARIEAAKLRTGKTQNDQDLTPRDDEGTITENDLTIPRTRGDKSSAASTSMSLPSSTSSSSSSSSSAARNQNRTPKWFKQAFK